MIRSNAQAPGLYDPRYEHDACGVAFVARLDNEPTREVVDFELPPAGRYGVGTFFLPSDDARRAKLEELIELNVRVEGQRVLGWRDVPVDEAHVGSTANASRPYVKQLFVGAGPGDLSRKGRSVSTKTGRASLGSHRSPAAGLPWAP